MLECREGSPRMCELLDSSLFFKSDPDKRVDFILGNNHIYINEAPLWTYISFATHAVSRSVMNGFFLSGLYLRTQKYGIGKSSKSSPQKIRKSEQFIYLVYEDPKPEDQEGRTSLHRRNIFKENLLKEYIITHYSLQ